SAMTRLDQNRARSLLANKAGARGKDVKKLAIWGNHSATLYPDFTNATVRGKAASEVIDRGWREKEFIPAVQQRGAAVIAARGASSAFSAAQALVDHVRSPVTATPPGGPVRPTTTRSPSRSPPLHHPPTRRSRSARRASCCRTTPASRPRWTSPRCAPR